MSNSIVYIVSFLEGFATLAVEVLAIRAATPIVGSSIMLTSIFLGIILLGLSAGYYMGGYVSQKLSASQRVVYLSLSLLFAGVYYVAITFPHEVKLIEFLLEATQNYVITLFLVAILLFFVPVFVESQSIPLLTELVKEKAKGKAAGTILFVSTLGSFLGSILPGLLLFETVGVSITMLVVGNMLFVSSGALMLPSRRLYAYVVWGTGIVLSVILYFFHPAFERPPLTTYGFDSAYQEILIRETDVDDETIRFFQTNRAFSSAIFTKTKETPFSYAREIIDLIKKQEPKTILVIGTAGFTIPYEVADLDFIQQIDTVDIDPRVKEIAEQYFLEEKLPEKVAFYPHSARYFVNHAIKEGKKYDMIIIDAYNGKSLPEELVTYEFFSSVDAISNSHEGVLFNFIHDTAIQSDLAHNVYTTLSAVFGTIYTKNVSQNEDYDMDNFLVATRQLDDDYDLAPSRGKIYTDDKRTTELDVVKMWWFNS